jgi:hypothetical protein
MIPTNADDWFIERETAKVLKVAKQSQWYWQYYCGNIWDVQWRGYIVPYDGTVDSPHFGSAGRDPWWRDNGDEDYDPNYLGSWGKMAKQYCGLAWVGGREFCVNGMQGQCYVGAVNHETGHNHSLRHSGSYDEDGDNDNYGDITCLMGGSVFSLTGLNSLKLQQLNLEAAREKHTIEASEQVLIAPIELPWNALRENEYQHIKVKNGSDVNISMRKTKGTKFPVATKYEGHLWVHTLVGAESKWHEPTVAPGEMRILPNGIGLVYHEYKSETARVSFIFPDENGVDVIPPDIPMPSGFPPSLPTASVEKHHSGNWYVPRYDGQGIDLHVRDDDIAAYWFTFDDDGNPIYYYWHCSREKALDQFKIYRTFGGTWDDPTTYQKEYVGKGKIEFIDADTGFFHYNLPDIYGRGVMQIEPAALSQNVINGLWFDPTKNGSGFTVQQFDNGTFSMLWYAFDNAGKQRWFTCTGSTDDYQLSIREIVGGEWLYFSDIEKPVVGAAFVTLTPTTIEFEYSIETTDINDDGLLSLQRLF